MTYGTEVHVILGKTPEEWDEMLTEARQRGDGVDVRFDPG